MALQLTMADAHRALVAAKSANARLANLREKGEAAAGALVRTAESAGTGYLLGLVNGAGVFKDSRIGPVPLELASAILFTGLRVLGLGGRHGEHLGNVGDASLACYTHILGISTGLAHWGSAKSSGSMGGDLADRLAQIAA
jgi:hypothetical protein